MFNREAILGCHILVVGCGALGNEVLKTLTLMGVGSLTIVDFDLVEYDNLDRSVLFRRVDVGRPKVDAARDALLRMNPDVRVDVIFGDVAFDVGIGLIRKMDVVVGCVDSRWARYCINRLSMRARRPWVDGGIFELTGTARAFAPDVNCYACSLTTDEMNVLRLRMPCNGVVRRQIQAGHAPTTAIVASVIGAIQAQEALKIAVGQGSDLSSRMAVYEGEQMQMRVVSFSAWDDDCDCHEPWIATTDSCLNVSMTVAEALHFVDAFCLRDDCFVDYLVSRHDDSRHEIMLPGRTVAQHIAEDPLLGKLPTSDYYQHEYRWIDTEFPYQELTLSQLGVTACDVIRTTNGFIETD